MIDLRNSIIRKKTPEDENPNKIVNVVDKIMEFNNQQEGKGLKTLTSKRMLRRLSIALSKVKTGNTEIRQILYSLYSAI